MIYVYISLYSLLDFIWDNTSLRYFKLCIFLATFPQVLSIIILNPDTKTKYISQETIKYLLPNHYLSGSVLLKVSDL